MKNLLDGDTLLTPGEVARMFRVDPRTVTRWGKAGLLPSLRTPGGHRRFPRSAVLQLLAGTLPTHEIELVREIPPQERVYQLVTFESGESHE